MGSMRYLLQFLINSFCRAIRREQQISWTRDTPWRQGHTLPNSIAIELGLVEKGQTEKIAIVVSHDCDLACLIEDEPIIEVLVGTRLAACAPDKTHAKNVRVLHTEINGPKGLVPFEFTA